jgi:uncharacterized coiled-coil protein SlyX
MTDQSIFDEGTPPQETPPSGSNEQVQAVDQLLGSIVNAEGKQKYATAEDLVKGFASAQEHISRLESENSTFKREVEKSTTLQDVLEAMKPTPDGEPAPAATLDEGKIAELLEKVVERKDTATAQKANVTSVTNKFKEMHGEQAEAKYYEAAANIGMSKSEINALAASNPTAVFAMLGVDAKQVAPKGGLNSSVSPAEFQQKPNEMPKFDPMKPSPNSALDKWRKVAAATNERLGLDN